MSYTDRVQAHTDERINRRLKEETTRRVIAGAIDSNDKISERIIELEREWDIERWLQTNASILALAGTVLGLVSNRKFFVVPAWF